MDEECLKRHLEELERVARLAEPMREAKELLGLTRYARALDDPLRYARELADPMHYARELANPLREARELQATLKYAREHLADPLGEFKEQLDPMRRAQEELRALAENPMPKAQEQIAAMYRDPMEQFREQVKAITDPLAGFRDAMDHGTNKIQQHLQHLGDPYHGVRDWLTAYEEEQREQFQQWRKLLDDFSHQIREMPARLRAQLAVLMARGWCLDPEMPHTWGEDLVKAIEEGEEEEAQEWLIGYFSKRMDEIEGALVERHPQRATVIAEAFAAHREGRFVLSIPVLLAQADGIIHDKHRRQLFSKKSSTNLQQVLEKLADDDTRAIFMAAFYVDIPLTQNTHQLPASFDGLNRHAVFHGTDAKYGTEVNSLRAVSVLNMASYFVLEEGGEAAAA